MFEFPALGAPPPRVIAPPIEPQVSDDQPEQIELEAPSLMPPPLDASVSDQRVIGPPLVRKATFSLVSTLRFDFSTRPWLALDTVMFAPTVKSLEAPVDVRESAPDEFMAPFTVMLP